MLESTPLFLPVILGTSRKTRFSEYVARFVTEQVAKQPNVATELIDVLSISLPTNDEGENIKDAKFSEMMNRADGMVLVVPEYNHGYPGSLKHLLDTNLKEYIHKAVGIVGVSAGPFGGTRVIQNLLPVMRELGLVNIFWDGNFSSVQKAFDNKGTLLDRAYERRIEKFIRELIWMSTVLRYGRLNISIQ